MTLSLPFQDHCHEKYQAAVSLQTRAPLLPHDFDWWAFCYVCLALGMNTFGLEFERAFYTAVSSGFFVSYETACHWHQFPRRQFGYFYHRRDVSSLNTPHSFSPVSFPWASKFLYLGLLFGCVVGYMAFWISLLFFVSHRDPGLQPYPVATRFFCGVLIF